MMNELPPYFTLLEKIKSEGESGLTEIVGIQTECFYIDYKEIKEDFSSALNLKSYWGILAKAISGFGNAQGGLLVFGIEDKTKSLTPFLGYKNLEVLVNEFISKSTNPRHEQVSTISISAIADPSKGYVVVEIPQSTNRPLQVISNDFNHQYFYRSGESHNLLPHDVLVGMLGKKIPPKLSYMFSTSIVEENEKFTFEVVVRNSGSVIAKDVWFNTDIGIPNVSIWQTNFTNRFEGAIVNNSCSLITKNDYKIPPQGFLSVLKLDVRREEVEITKELHFYFSFGCEGSKMYEFNSIFTGEQFNEAIRGSFDQFAEFLKSKSPDHIIERT